ncbi:MAG: penicillin acylase family protein [Rhodobacteraceae bacterium]|nr:penicillin acylase family protein [Paracoccaceae bacterium]
MTSVFRWLLRGFTVMSVLILVTIILAYYFATRSIPDYNASYDLRGLSGPVEIVRDPHNVPHIFSDNPDDIYFALGFVHAQDRLWQMTMMRRTAQGRLSEIFGSATANTDEFVRRLDLVELSRKSYAFQTEEVKSALDSYAAGVNAWLGIVRNDALGRGAPEFFFLGPEIAPWSATDSLSIIRVMSLQLSGHLRNEVLRARVSLEIGKDRVRDIMPDAPGTGTIQMPEFAGLFGGLSRVGQAAGQTHWTDPIKSHGLAGASNAWAAAPERSATGASLLANDPHLALSAPAIWYLARLDFPDGGVIGGTIPGIPVVLTGRSDALAWGLTTAYVDDLDIYVEEINPDNPNQYRTSNGWKEFVTKDVIMHVDGEVPRTLHLRWTDNGPVIPGKHYGLASITPEGHVATIRWTALDANDQSMTAGINLMRAKSVKAGLAATAVHKAPAQNLTLADRNGVALQMIGKMPLRKDGHESRGRFPTRGWMEINQWLGYADYAENPSVVNPKSGIVANTNNKTTDRAFPYHVSHSWGGTYRFLRLMQLLNAQKVHTRDSFIEAQTDTGNFAATALLPLIAKELWFTGEAAPENTPERQRQTALGLLANWNGKMDKHIPEPLIYAAWMRELQHRLIADDMPGLATNFPRPNPVFLERVFRNIDGAGIWCDITQTSRTETCEDVARIALDQAILELTQAYGDRVTDWRWGEAHVAHHDHQMLGTVPGLAWFANIRHETSGGAETLMRASWTGEGDTPYANIHAAAFRSVIDFSDPDSSVYIIATGQSGHFLSHHYDDLSGLWQRGEYILMSLDPNIARSGAVGVTTLQPE